MDPEIQAQIDALRLEYIASLGPRMQELWRGWHEWNGKAENREACRQVHRVVHDLAGSSGAFKLERLHELAAALNPALRTLHENPVDMNDEARKAMVASFEQLQEVVDELAATKVSN